MPCTLGEEGLGEVWKGRGEEEEVGGERGAKQGLLTRFLRPGRRRARGSGAAGKPGPGLAALRRRAGAA